MIAFLLSKPGQYLLGGLVALALLLAAYAYVDHRGYARAEIHYKGVIAAEHTAAITARNSEVERQAARQNEAKAREAEHIAEMQAEADQLTKQVEELQREASEDPDADRTALGATSVRRINQIR
ncbi:hypothetical protein [Rhizobium ruizarguesonis]|uniref:hypothetical protein n=1 Tax=Rhizobium ruizarguesonis TaxID=2081791 RepID=UPI001030FD64|nr:hypothetical protein [Rhizobium ruizarguesonis]TBC21578.1 hypothetical protein ELH34_16145 [Rhizobium ruizarguesonis]